MKLGGKREAAIAEGWVLEGYDGEGRLLSLSFAENELAVADFGVSVGRHPSLCERVIEDPSVSRRHLRLSLRQGRLAVEDLNSLNGTLLDGKLLAPFQAVPAEPGHSLTLGAVALRIREVSA